MPRPQVDKECLHHITHVMKHSEELIDTIKKGLVLEMLQQNAEVTDAITAASFSVARAFCEKFHIEPSADNLKNLIADMVFMNGISPIIKELIKADKEAGND